MPEPCFTNFESQLNSIAMAETFRSVVENEKPTLVDFFAEWCGPCKMMKPILEQLKSKLGNKVRIIKIDIDRNPELSQALQIQGVPTLVLFKNGEILWRESGVRQAAELERIISNHIQ